MPEDDELLTRRQAADRAGVTSGTIRLWERAGRLHPIPTGDAKLGPLYSASELERAVDRAAQLRAAAMEVSAAHTDTLPFDTFTEEAADAMVEAETGVQAPPEAGEPVRPARAGKASRPPAVLIRERLLKGSGWVLLGTAAGTVIGTVASGLLARILAPTDLGAYFLAFSIATLGATLSQLGMERAVVRFVAAALGTGLPGRARRSVKIVFAAAALGSLFIGGIVAVWLGQFLAEHVFHSVALASVTTYVAVWIVVAAFQSLFAETFRSFQRFWLATVFNGVIVDLVCVAVFGTLYLSRGQNSATLAQAILITVGAITFTLVIAAIILGRRYAKLRGPGDVRVHEVWDVAWPLLGFNIATFAVGKGLDIWVVGALASQADVALYGAAAKLVFYVATPFIIASQVVPPIIAELWAQGKKRQLEHSLREISTLAGVPAALVLLLFLVAGPWVMQLVYGRAFYREGALVLAVLSIARLYAVVTGNSGAALQMTGYQRTMMYLTFFSGAIGVMTKILFGNLYGMIGVAYATAAAQILQNSLQLYYARKKLGIWTQAELSLRPFIALVKRTA
jgi:O-antigen/teichoic acid export membrane protein